MDYDEANLCICYKSISYDLKMKKKKINGKQLSKCYNIPRNAFLV